jgi:hypothetical protein
MEGLLAGAHYDGIAGVMRLIEAGKEPDTFALKVVTYHAVIESEIEGVISSLVRRPEGLFTTSPRMTFGHKIHLLKALWAGNPEQADKLCAVLHRFQDVRNAVAHPDPKQIKGCVAGLTVAYREIDPTIGDEVEILEAAQGICLFLQDGSNVTELKALFDGLDQLVTTDLPNAIGGHHN